MPTGREKLADTFASERGFTYLALLVIVAIMGILLTAGSQVWQQAVQREKEKELLFVGDQFRKAIGLYYQRTPGAVKRYPTSMEELLLDPRYPAKQRYLRKIFRDPMTGESKWGMVRAPEPEVGFIGVYSLGSEVPLKTGNFRMADQAFVGKMGYAEWQFVYTLPK